MKVLIVDDSVVYRNFIKEALGTIPGVEVVGLAANGKIALQKLEQLPGIDLVTLDLEMPELDGLGMLKEIKQRKLKIPVLVFASETATSAHQAFEAMKWGALDFLAKPKADAHDNAHQIKVQLTSKIRELQAVSHLTTLSEKPHPVVKAPATPQGGWAPVTSFKPQVVVVGSSTGGPNALEVMLKHLVLPLSAPILITQHMPPFFTTTFAERLSKVTGLPCYEAKHGQVLAPATLYVAPGNYHMTLNRSGGKGLIQLDQEPHINSVRPAVDPLFESAARCYFNHVMAYVLTGMGEDGARGAAAVRTAGGKVAIQSEASCVVYGMPGAVAQTCGFDAAGSPDELGDLLNQQLK